MRILTIPYQARTQPRLRSYRRDKSSTWRRRHQSTAYPGLVRKTGSGNRDLPEFGRWLRRWLDAKASDEGVSLRRLIEDKGANRANIYRWFKLDSSMEGPEREIVDREFDKLGIPEMERIEPYGHLGWKIEEPARQLSEVEAKRERVEAILRMQSLTPEEREKYEEQRRSIEAVEEAVMDSIIADFERRVSEAPSEEPGE